MCCFLDGGLFPTKSILIEGESHQDTDGCDSDQILKLHFMIYWQDYVITVFQVSRSDLSFMFW
ncbi:unnamed protein product [Camellia sinensis]